MSDEWRFEIKESVWELRIWVNNNINNDWYYFPSGLLNLEPRKFYFKSKEDAIRFRLTFL